MKSNLRWLLLLIPLALFAWAYQVASWRPKLIGVQPTVPRGNGLKRIPLQTAIGSSLLISPDGAYLASGGYNNDRFVTLWKANAAAQQKVWQQERNHNAWISPLAFSPDSRSLAVLETKATLGDAPTKIILFDVASGKIQKTIAPISKGLIQSAAFLSNRALTVATSQGAFVVDAQTGATIRQWKFALPTLQNTKRPLPNQSHISADGTTILALANGSFDTAVAIYDTQSGKQRGTWIYEGVFRNPRLSPDGTLWALEREKYGGIDVYDAQTGQKLWGPFAGSTNFAHWTWSADSQRLVISTKEGVSIFDARKKTYLGRVEGARRNSDLLLSPDDNFLYTLDHQGKIWRWRAR